MSNKIVAPAAINALIDALGNIYWFKNELRNFLINTISDSSILNSLNWADYKRNIASRLVNHYARQQDIYKDDLLNLMIAVTRICDFSHLERLDDGKAKATKARNSINALRNLMGAHVDIVAEQKRTEERKRAANEKLREVQGINQKIDEIKNDYLLLCSSQSPQERGYKLERIMCNLFALFDLDPKASFKILGEQIDGAFTFDSNDYLFEGKWQKELVGIQELDAFSGKLTRKLKNTLGLYLSINGFSSDAVKVHFTGNKQILLMDGSDLMGVLEGRIALDQLLRRKRQHASQTGNIYFHLQDIMEGR